MTDQQIRTLAKRIFPDRFLNWLWIRWNSPFPWPPVGRISSHSLWQIRPVSPIQGVDRGKSIDRYYIERFLDRNRLDVSGRVLEIGDNTYTRIFGADRVALSDVLHVDVNNAQATIIGDLCSGSNLQTSVYDCIVLTQTLPFIYDVPAAIRTLHRILKPGGVLLVTVPGISQIIRYDMDRWGDYWRFTTLSVRRLFEEVFMSDDIDIEAYGNVMVAVAFLHGLAKEDLQVRDLDYKDPDYQVLITLRVVKH